MKHKQETECAGKRHRGRKEKDGTKDRVSEEARRKGIFRMIGIVGDARDAECRGVESAVFKWGGH